MDIRDENKKKSLTSGSSGDVPSKDIRTKEMPSCSFASPDFDPVIALSTPDLCRDDSEIFEDLYALRVKVHSEDLNVMHHIGIEGVAGPGGIPVAKTPRPKIPEERKFTEDQAPLPGKPRKRLRNVLTRMEEIQGPLATLRVCRDAKKRIKVYTRNHSEVRGIMTGYVVAFDKHWNLVMRDVEEIFQKKIKCKTPIFGDVTNFTKMADLSLREEDAPEAAVDSTSQVWMNPFAQKPQSSHTSEGSLRSADTKISRESRSSLGRRVDREVFKASSTFSRDAEILRLGRTLSDRPDVSSASESDSEAVKEKKGEKKERYFTGLGKEITKADSMRRKDRMSKDSAMERSRREIRISRNEEDPDERKHDRKQSPNREGEKRKHRRRRKKRELRQRYISQILVRGENVVLVNVLEA